MVPPPSAQVELRQPDDETTDEVRTDGERERAAHRARVRASLAWALVEHADTLAKLAK